MSCALRGQGITVTCAALHWQYTLDHTFGVVLFPFALPLLRGVALNVLGRGAYSREKFSVADAGTTHTDSRVGGYDQKKREERQFCC